MSHFRDAVPSTAPSTFSYTPTGRAVPASAPVRTPGPRPAAPSCTPTGRIVLSTRPRCAAA